MRKGGGSPPLPKKYKSCLSFLIEKIFLHYTELLNQNGKKIMLMSFYNKLTITPNVLYLLKQQYKIFINFK